MTDTRNAPEPIIEIENTWIPLSDGVRLAARIWMPADVGESPVPAILEYIPYRKDDGTAHDDARRHPYFASHGYAAVRVDIRGTGDSDGVCLGEYLPQEQADAIEVLSWLEAQPWCTGSVGMIGYSWGGFNGLQVAAHRPPQLKAVITGCSTDDRYLDDCHYMGGCMLSSDMLKWAATMLAYNARPPDPRFVGTDWREKWLARLEETPPYSADWIAHQRRDDFWKQGSVAEDYEAIDCAVLAFGGWADAYTNAIPRLLEHLTCPCKGLIGPWGHMFPDSGVPGPAIDFLAECVRWWDRWLKSIDNGIDREPMLVAWMQESIAPAEFYAERPGRWVALPEWPPPGIAQRVLALGDDLTAALPVSPTVAAWASATGEAGVDSGADSKRAGASAATAEPGAPAVAIRGSQLCGEAAGVWCANGMPDELPADQQPDDERSLTFTSEPLSEPLEILGFPLVRLSLASEEPLALVAVRLCDVAPSDESTLVTWGQLNLTHRDGHQDLSPLEPNEPIEVELPLSVIAHRFSAGHRLRVSISPTYWPHAWPSPVSATLRIVVDGSSSVALPVVSATLPSPAPFADPAEPDLTWWPGPAHHERFRTRRYEEATGAFVVDDRERRTARFDASSGSSWFEASDLYSIAEGDPLSARVECRRRAGFTRPDGWDWEVRTDSIMTCDATRFYVTDRVAATAGPDAPAPAFERTWKHVLVRDLG